MMFDNLGKAARGEPISKPAEPRRIKKQTLYLPLPVWRALREISLQEEVSQQEIFRQSLDLWFAEHGLPSWQQMADMDD